LKTKKAPDVRFSILPSPSWGVILTQTCDIENAKEGASIICAELYSFDNHKEINSIVSNTKKREYIGKIIDKIRCQPAEHYFPEIEIKNEGNIGPLLANFRNTFFVSTDLVKENLDVFWKARLIDPAKEVLKEKISRFFTRLAFDECIFFNGSEIEHYIELIRKKQADNIKKTRKRWGFDP